MKFSLKKVVASTGAAVLLAGVVAPGVSAATPETQAVEEVSQSEIEELEQFVTVNSDDTLTFDSATALEQGYAEDLVSFVEQNIESMNNLVINHDGVLNSETLTVTNYIGSDITTYSGGQSKVETNLLGVTQIYLNDTEAQNLISTYDRTGSIATAVSSIGGIGASIATAVSTQLVGGQIESAASGGNGIIIHHQPSSNIGVGAGTGPNVWVTSQ